MDFSAYVAKHRVRDIINGQSGATVCEISGERIAKYVQRKSLNDEQRWLLYVHEIKFYQYARALMLPYVPKVLQVSCTDNELLLLLGKYHSVSRRAINDAWLDKVADVLARIHALDVPDFIQKPDYKPTEHSKDAVAAYVQGWSSVLAEHGSTFKVEVLQEIARNFNKINSTFYSRRRCFTHGDFHFENLLEDASGNIVVCDWQGCGCGDPSGDLSFLISRLLADGCAVDADKLIDDYCRHANQLGADITPDEVHMQMQLANLNTSFVFWHQYLHGASVERVRDLYQKMMQDYGKFAERL